MVQQGSTVLGAEQLPQLDVLHEAATGQLSRGERVVGYSEGRRGVQT